MDIGLFRQNFPEFSDLDRYPISQITFWASVAEMQVRQCIWKDMWTVGCNLYVAHEISLASQTVTIAEVGGNPGLQMASGPTSSKAVGGGNISYDTNVGAEKDAGVWNLTPYGKQFYRLMKMFGAGAIQIGARPGRGYPNGRFNF